MAESLEDQLYYGDLCLHGTNIGTPGGYDILCPLCEDGLNVWQPDKRYTLMVDAKNLPYPINANVYWSERQLEDLAGIIPSLWDDIMKWAKLMQPAEEPVMYAKVHALGHWRENETVYDLEVCMDCANLIANGEMPHDNDAYTGLSDGWDGWHLFLDDGVVDFSKRQCDGCDSRLAGVRHQASAYERSSHWSDFADSQV